ncbi:MAG: hypothetical protein Q9159_005848 [Coniocarpon cinnabarinum]
MSSSISSAWLFLRHSIVSATRAVPQKIDWILHGSWTFTTLAIQQVADTTPSLPQYLQSRTASSSDSRRSKPRGQTSRCSTPSRSSSRQEFRSTTPEGSPFEGRLHPNETRQELIERKKREQRATWLQKTYVPSSGPLGGEENASSSQIRSLLPPAEIAGEQQACVKAPVIDHLEVGSSIGRPRSALHRGDFRQDDEATSTSSLQPGSPYPFRTTQTQRDQWISTFPTSPWYQPRVPVIPSLPTPGTFAGFGTQPESHSLYRPRAASYSARSLSLALQPPTSPLVNTTNNSDSDGDHDRLVRPSSPEKFNRRRTFSPGALRAMRPMPTSNNSSPVTQRPLPNVRRDNVLPYQAHQPSRSINSFNDRSGPSFAPQSPSARTRRPSLASESSPLQRAPMVGRYEESILRGRMSSLPSRPLDFVAQIGVLGKGKCKSSLRCPPHVAVPFPAVFYNYGSRPSSPNKASDGPSPYVGMIDLESLEPSTGVTQSKSPSEVATTASHDEGSVFDGKISFKVKERPGRYRQQRQSSRPGPKGGYRIPEKGQLQIIIKNPNKTAVKLFLIPYDLEGMQPGQKTFIRQRSYSAGPIIDMPVSARRNFGTDRPEASLTNSDEPKDRPVLRYLIHLNICCPSKGRYFLYKTIRVVFANRVPDGKERLRQEIQLPDPKYSIWRPDQDVARNTEPSLQQQRSTSHDCKSQRALGSSQLDRMDGLVGSTEHTGNGGTSRAFTFPVKDPFSMTQSAKPVHSRDNSGDVPMHTPPSPLSDRVCRGCPPAMKSPPNWMTFERLARDEYGEGAVNRRPHSPVPGDGALSLHLRNLAASRPSIREQ